MVCLLERPTHYLQFYGGQDRYSVLTHCKVEDHGTVTRSSFCGDCVRIHVCRIGLYYFFMDSFSGPGDERVKSHLTSLVELDFDNG